MAPVSLSPLTQTYARTPRGLHVGARSSDGTSRRASWRSLCDAMARRIGVSELMHCVPHAVSAAIMTPIDQRRRHDCRAGSCCARCQAQPRRPWSAIRARGAYIYASCIRTRSAERRVRLSTEAQEALAGLSVLADHDIHRPTLAHDDDVFSALTLDERPWEEPATAGPSSLRALRRSKTSTRRTLRPTMWSPSILVRSASLPCSGLLRNKHWRVGSHAGSGASAASTPRRWRSPTLRLLWHQVEHQEIPCTRSCRPARARRLTRRHQRGVPASSRAPARHHRTSASSGCA